MEGRLTFRLNFYIIPRPVMFAWASWSTIEEVHAMALLVANKVTLAKHLTKQKLKPLPWAQWLCLRFQIQ